jgi:hypothetical protein
MAKAKKAKTVAPTTAAVRVGARPKDALSLSRLASFVSLNTALLYICLNRVPHSFVTAHDPLVEEPIATLIVLSGAAFCCQLLTASRFRQWYLKDAKTQAEAQGKTFAESDSVKVSMPL